MDGTTTAARPSTEESVDTGLAFLRLMFDPQDVIEVRLVEPAAQRWFRLADDAAARGALRWAAGQNARERNPKHVYFGANPRTAHGKGTAADVPLARVLFADFDDGMTPDAALDRVRAAGLPEPSIVVASGGGVHVWWVLDTPITDMATWIATMKAIIAKVGSDDAIHDPPRLMRLPGFANVKPERPGRPLCHVVSHNETRHPLAAFPVGRVFVEKPTKAGAAASTKGGVSDETEEFFKTGKLRGKSRVKALWRIYCDLKGRGWTVEAAEKEIMEQVPKINPPMQKKNVADIPRQIRNAFAEERDPGYKSTPAQKRMNAIVAAAASDEPHSGGADLTKRNTLTDTGLGRRLAKMIRGRLAYVRERKAWIAWDGRRWAEHGEHAVELQAKRMHDELWREIGDLDEKPRDVVQFVMDSGHRARIAAAVAMAQSEPGVSVSWEEFDKHPWLLNVRNGVLDLRSGDLLPHDPKLRLTQLADVEYVPDATSELWERFIREVTCGDEELADFLRQSFGIALTGDVSDELLLCHKGEGCNGKTTCLEALSRMLGDYAAVAPPGMFASRNSEGHPTEIAGLRGKRLVTSSEQDADRTLRESLIKTLTGGDTIRTRGMREDFWEMQPTWHVHLAFNREPRLSGSDGGIRRRLRTVPWDASFEAAPDPTIKARLTADDERPGILAWCLEGLRRRLGAGSLPYPEAVRITTEGYLAREDLIGKFIEECTERAGPSIVVRLDDILPACRGWLASSGVPQRVVDGVSVRTLTRELGLRGIRTDRPDGGEHRKKCIAVGLRLVQTGDDAAADRARNRAP